MVVKSIQSKVCKKSAYYKMTPIEPKKLSFGSFPITEEVREPIPRIYRLRYNCCDKKVPNKHPFLKLKPH
jgi:hypothetical protein